MTTESTPEALIDIRTPKGTAIQARLAETPVHVLLRTPQVLCQVIVDANQSRYQRELMGRSDA